MGAEQKENTMTINRGRHMSIPGSGQKILNHLREHGPRTVSELAYECDVHIQTVRNNLNTLQHLGKVERLATYPPAYDLPKEPEPLTLEDMPPIVFDRDRIDFIKEAYHVAHPDDNDLAGTIKRLVKSNKNSIPKAIAVLNEWAQALKEIGEKKNGNESAKLGD